MPFYERAAALADRLGDRTTMQRLLQRVTVRADALCLAIGPDGLRSLVFGENAGDLDRTTETTPTNITVPVLLKRRGVEAKLIVQPATETPSRRDDDLIAGLARAHRCIEELTTGRARTMREIARRAGTDPGDLSRTLPLGFIAPDIVEAILAGRQPVELTPNKLKRLGALPLSWTEQRRVLGFPL